MNETRLVLTTKKNMDKKLKENKIIDKSYHNNQESQSEKLKKKEFIISNKRRNI